MRVTKEFADCFHQMAQRISTTKKFIRSFRLSDEALLSLIMIGIAVSAAAASLVNHTRKGAAISSLERTTFSVPAGSSNSRAMDLSPYGTQDVETFRVGNEVCSRTFVAPVQPGQVSSLVVCRYMPEQK